MGDQEDASNAIGKSSKRDVDLASKGLMCWGVVLKSGYITKEAVASSGDLEPR